MFIKLINFRRN